MVGIEDLGHYVEHTDTDHQLTELLNPADSLRKNKLTVKEHVGDTMPCCQCLFAKRDEHVHKSVGYYPADDDKRERAGGDLAPSLGADERRAVTDDAI